MDPQETQKLLEIFTIIIIYLSGMGLTVFALVVVAWFADLVEDREIDLLIILISIIWPVSLPLISVGLLSYGAIRLARYVIGKDGEHEQEIH